MYVEILLTPVAIWLQSDLLPICHRVGNSTTGEYSFPTRGRKGSVVFQKVTYTQSTALAAFFTFVRAFRIAEWITGIETSPRIQEGMFQKKEITILQGNPKKKHQKVTFRFSNYTEPVKWLIVETIFSGNNGRGDWSRTFKTFIDLVDHSHVFVPEGVDPGNFMALSREIRDLAMRNLTPAFYLTGRRTV